MNRPTQPLRSRCAPQNPLYLTFAILVAGSLLLASAARAQLLPPTADDRKVAVQVAKMLTSEHLLKMPLDDTISARTFDHFIEALDPQRLYFLQSDISEFAKHRTQLDDDVRTGNLAWAWRVYERFLQRVDERVAINMELLAEEHDFTLQESVEIDRENAPFARDGVALRELWRKRIKFNLLEKKADEETQEDALTQLRKRYTNFKRRMHQTSNDELLQIFLTSLTTSYDPHTTYMSATTLENFEIAMRLELEGIGASLEEQDGYTTVRSIIPGGAADRDGRLQIDDKIVAVGQGREGEYVDVVDWKLTDVVKLIRGKKGTIVRLKLKRAGKAESLHLVLERAKVELKESEARGEILEEGSSPDGKPFKVGVIDLPSFYMDMAAARRGARDYKSTSRDVARILDRFRAQHVDGVLVDLRANGGGSLTEAIRMTGLFIDKGPVVQVKDAEGEVYAHPDEIPGYAWDGPLVVLTSKFSASASEIFAGAIQDYARGLVIGDHSTHGKGTVQNLEDIGQRVHWFRPRNLGALKITRQQFYRPSGASTQNRGVLADVELPSLTSHLDVGEAQLDYAIPFDRVPPVSFDKLRWVNADMVRKLDARSRARRATNEEFAGLAARIARYEERKNRTTLSLHEQEFLDDADAQELESQSEDSPGPRSKPAKEEDEESFIQRDFYFDEALAVTHDYLGLLGTNGLRTP